MILTFVTVIHILSAAYTVTYLHPERGKLHISACIRNTLVFFSYLPVFLWTSCIAFLYLSVIFVVTFFSQSLLA